MEREAAVITFRFMIPSYEYRQCLSCEFIEDCPHPTVNMEGRAVPPNHCIKADKIKLIRRVDEITARDDNGI